MSDLSFNWVYAPRSPFLVKILFLIHLLNIHARFLTFHSIPLTGLLASLASIFNDLGLDVIKADIGSSESGVNDKFWVRTIGGGKVADVDIPAVKAAVEASLTVHSGKGKTRPKLKVTGAAESRTELLHTLMGKQQKNSSSH